MTASLTDLLLYAGGMLALFMTPGPVWVAVTARTLSGGFRAAWPLALGVTVGDILWPFLAILGVTWVVGTFDGFMLILRWVAAGIFLLMGIGLIRTADRPISQDTRLTRPGMWAGFAAGVAVILSNPKAILFYMGVLPGFFDLTQVTTADIAAIVFLSAIVPLVGNLAMAAFVARLRMRLTKPSTLVKINRISGTLLILVGVIIPFT